MQPHVATLPSGSPRYALAGWNETNLQGSITTNDLNTYPDESSINGNKLNSRTNEVVDQLASLMDESTDEEQELTEDDSFSNDTDEEDSTIE